MNWIAAVLWGGIVGLDATSFPQVMLSRPLVAASITGLIFGRPAEGAVLGIVLELLSLVVLPIGAARYPESGTASVAATLAYISAIDPSHFGASPLLVATVFGLSWEFVTGASVNLLRRTNEWLIADATARAPLGALRLERLQLSAMALDLARAIFVVAAGGWLGSWILAATAPMLAGTAVSAAGILGVGGAIMLGASLQLFGGWSERRLVFLIGIVCGSILLLNR